MGPSLTIKAADGDGTAGQTSSTERFYWAASGNRRLYVFRKLEADGLCEFIECRLTSHLIRQEQVSTRNGGSSVFMRSARRSAERGIPLYCKGCRKAAMCSRGFCGACCPAYSAKYCAIHCNQNLLEAPEQSF